MAIKTPLTAQLLNRIAGQYDWGQDQVALRSGLNRSTVAMHLAGSRPVHDIHVRCYLRALKRSEQLELLGVWLKDLAGDDLPAVSSKKNVDAIVGWKPALPPADRAMLMWLANQMVLDAELSKLVKSVCRRLGYPNSR